MSGRILFVDTACPEPYDGRTLRDSPLGGTEATVVRVARALAAEGRDVVVAQRGRVLAERVDGVDWVPYQHKSEWPIAGNVEQLVVIRSHKVLARLRRRHPTASMYLWMHCFPGQRLRGFGRAAAEVGATVIAVSRHHREAMRDFLEEHDPEVAFRLPIVAIHNPVDDALQPEDDGKVDPNKLVFLSSPHKGLEQVLSLFEAARERLPSLRLHVANPGYLNWKVPLPRGVFPLGTLRHADAMEHMRGALCLFYPQSSFAETFGLVFAEANAVGTPVLTHPVGAAHEVLLGDERQLVDASKTDEVVERLVRWHRGERPEIEGHTGFRLSTVVRVWEQLFETPSSAVGTGRIDVGASGVVGLGGRRSANAPTFQAAELS